MTMSFERSALGFVGILFVALLTVAVSDPLIGATATPKVSMLLPERAAKAEVVGWKTESMAFAGNSAVSLTDTFKRMGYDLKSGISGHNIVPRIFIASLPSDMSDIRENEVRKLVFFKSILPLVLHANEEISAERRRLWQLRYQIVMGEGVDPIDRLWLEVMTERYRVKEAAIGVELIDSLLRCADVIPPSLALAQAAEESGWGTSRYVREGNAIFGQWAFSPSGNLTPGQRDEGKSHGIRAFSSLLDSVKAYALNLNSHRSYREFREAREEIRGIGATVDGMALAGRLKSYSERGMNYVRAISAIIDVNNLRHLDKARLGDLPRVTGPSI
ncbi:MAG: hypothetical protein A3G18_01020 [Rhodospirillales bacterium RIFCSPLOWO2_12_FULL_58_28]|nr:MAG: hypothetical protein A3H92_04225 [Rhodospirillales bacterium RIFCSPLOWO2_02_FULL_58_16]OHC77987.1 MAG: hypothetical protein A3G18_01020 [Rhodospirillales bacterium RIFCSPLOWO2_12_FULL_58_28]